MLTLSLEARLGVWHPDGPNGAALETAAFAEPGKPLQTPGPLVRVSAGTRVEATVRNGLATPMWLYGMGARRGPTDSVRIDAGVTARISLTPTEPGAYHYAARTGPGPVTARLDEASQLGGVIIVDSPGSTSGERARSKVHERIRVGALAFNGGVWPATERLVFDQGDTVRFRIVNRSMLGHPLHLHGFYFTVDARGTASATPSTPATSADRESPSSSTR